MRDAKRASVSLGDTRSGHDHAVLQNGTNQLDPPSQQVKKKPLPLSRESENGRSRKEVEGFSPRAKMVS